MAARLPEQSTEPRAADAASAPNLADGKGRPPRLRFGPFVADPETGRLMEGERHIPLAPKPFETLYYLAFRAGRVIAKSELMEQLWRDTFVTDDVLVQSVMDIRRALGDTAKAPQYVQTLPRRGYQFLAAVRVMTGEEASAAVEAAVPPPPEPLPASEPAIRRTPRVLTMSAAAAIMVVTALGLWRARADRPSAPPPETAQTAVSQAPAEPGSLLVMPIVVPESSAEKEWLRNGLAEMIRAQLGQTRGIHVVPHQRLSATLAKVGLPEEGWASAERAEDIARRLRAEWLVTTSYVRVEDDFVLTAQVVDVFAGRTHGTAVVRGRHPNDLLDAVDALCLKLLQQLRPLPVAPADASWHPTGLATRSVEASQRYFEALDVWFRVGGRPGGEDAVAKLDQALALDPSFAQAYVKKAEILHWLATEGYGSPDAAPAILAAARLAKDLPERDQLLITGLEALIVRHQPDAAVRAMQSLLEIYPTYAQEAGVPGLLLETLMRLGRWDDMIRIGEAQATSPSIPEYQRATVHSVLAQAYRRKGEFGPAIENARRAVQLWPVRDRPEWLTQRAFLGRICVDAGRRDDALKEFRAMAAAPEADAPNLTEAAWGLYMAGEVAEAKALVERSLALDDSYGSGHHLHGWMRMAEGDYTRAAQSLEKAFEKTPAQFGRVHQGLLGGDVAALYYAGVAWQKAGDRRRADAVLTRATTHCRRFAKLSVDDSGPAARWQAANFIGRAKARMGATAPEPPRLAEDDSTFFVQSARLHAVQGRKEAALRELAQGLALGFGEYRHLQDDPDFESLREEAEFARLVTAPLHRLTASVAVAHALSGSPAEQ
jgi:DNA-binding winged helix-turn-helix (wHTH) protein/tetratricopeptide (TPR) repeat protein/TolB-like protein